MESRTFEIDVCPQTAPPLVSADGYVVVVYQAERKAAQQQVTVRSTIKTAVFTEPVMVAKFLGNESRLVLFMLSTAAHYFLKGNNVCIKLTQHSYNADWPDAAIQSPAFVDVVGCDPNCLWHCFREDLTPLGASSFSSEL